MYGIALYHTGRYGEAAEVLKNYEDEESRGFYARALMEIGTDEALREAESIFTSLGDMGSAAACALKLGEYERVISYLKGQDDEESAGMKFEAYINLGRKEEAAGMYNKLPESVRAAYAKDMCSIFMELGRYSDAESVLNTYFYEDHEWLMLKAKLSINRRDYETAISSLRHAKKLNPHDAEVSRLLAPLLLNAGHESDALKEAKRAVKDFPDDAICWYNLGLAYHRTGNTKKAIEALQKSVSLDESLLEAWHLLGLIYLDSRDYENAYSALSRVKDRIEDRDVLMSLAMTAYQIEKYDEALGYIDRAMSMSRDHMALYYRALILIELDREEEAMEDLKEAIEMNPGFVEARKLLGDIMGGE
jgi:tetratricopeptide (TPR) repeat protein